jgi:choline dehydrogenase-like flavoprotein
MASDPQLGAVGPDFALHGARGIWVADSSVFPSNTGVNPQTAILALATLCGQAVAQQLGLA